MWKHIAVHRRTYIRVASCIEGNGTTEACIFRISPQLDKGSSIKSLVNIFTYEAEHFEQQAINLKKLYYKFNARCIAMDANGVGAGLVDYMVKTQIDPETGDELPPFGVGGGTSEDAIAPYKKIKGYGVENDALYLIKAHANENTEMFAYVKAQMFSGKVKFLIDESQAKAKLMSTKMGQEMNPDDRNEYLKPFVMTDILKEQLLNLREENEGLNIILKLSSKTIRKDKFSAMCYGLYYAKKEEDIMRSRKRHNIADFMFFT